MNPLFDLLTKSELALELDASIAELNAKQARIESQSARIAELEAALAPFSKLSIRHHDNLGNPDSYPMYQSDEFMITVGDVRNARKVLQKGGGNG